MVKLQWIWKKGTTSINNPIFNLLTHKYKSLLTQIHIHLERGSPSLSASKYRADGDWSHFSCCVLNWFIYFLLISLSTYFCFQARGIFPRSIWDRARRTEIHVCQKGGEREDECRPSPLIPQTLAHTHNRTNWNTHTQTLVNHPDTDSKPVDSHIHLWTKF